MNTVSNDRWLTMLAGYASHHQHPTNAVMHIIGVPFIMLGMFVPMSAWAIPIAGVSVSVADIVLLGLFLFYLRLDVVCALAFAAYAVLVLALAKIILTLPFTTAALISAVCFFGGYALQFWGHAIEGRAPVLVKHPIQANVSAPLFITVEVFKFLGLRENMFKAMDAKVAELSGDDSTA